MAAKQLTKLARAGRATPAIETLAPITSELIRGAQAFVKLRSIGAGSFEGYDEALRDVFVHTERMWRRAAAAAKDVAQWSQLRSNWTHERRTDPLLLYASHARNVNEHDIAPIVKDWDANFRVDRPINPTRFLWNPWSRDLQAVVDRGVTYHPPTSHLSRTLSKQEQTPPGVAALAMAYYVGVYNVVLREIYNVRSSGEAKELFAFVRGLERRA